MRDLPFHAKSVQGEITGQEWERGEGTWDVLPAGIVLSPVRRSTSQHTDFPTLSIQPVWELVLTQPYSRGGTARKQLYYLSSSATHNRSVSDPPEAADCNRESLCPLAVIGEGWESRADGQGGAHSVGIGGVPASHPSFLTEGLGQHPPPPHTWPSACPPTLPTLHEIPQRLCHWMTKLAPSELLILPGRQAAVSPLQHHNLGPGCPP